MICMKNLTFSSRPGAKVRLQGLPSSARARPCSCYICSTYKEAHFVFLLVDKAPASIYLFFLILVTHGCIVATVTLFLPDGKEATK